MSEYKAVLSTTVLPKDGTYSITTLSTTPDLKGIKHYIGHRATLEIVENLGAIPATSGYFPGLEPGEAAVSFSIKSGRSSRAVKSYTLPHQEVTLDDLVIREIRRIN